MGRKDLKENYRLNFYQFFFEMMFAQISDFFDGIFSKHQCESRKRCTTHHCHSNMSRKWRKCFDKGKVIGTLSKAFESRYSRIAK